MSTLKYTATLLAIAGPLMAGAAAQYAPGSGAVNSLTPEAPADTGSEPFVTRAFIVSGLNLDADEQQAKDRAVMRLRRTLIECGVPEDRISVLVSDLSLALAPGSASTATELRRVLAHVAETLTQQDTFLFYYTGQANAVGDGLRLNLPGPDITHEDLAEMLAPLRTRAIIVLDCPGAGMAAKALAGPERIVICGARGDQPYSTRFSDFFVPAFTDWTSDRNGDGRLSLLEAFQQAAERTDQLYREQELLKTENALLDDNGDGIPSQQPWRFNSGATADGGRVVDGRKAADIVIIRRSVPQYEE